MPSIFKSLLLIFVVLFQTSALADNRYSYNARFQCGSNNSVTNNEYFYASTDMEAKNEVMRILNSNTSYRGRGCKLIDLTSNKPQPQPQRVQSKSYEVRIQCGSNSSSSSTQYFSADSDLEAENEARRILNNNTAFRGKNCQVTEINSR